MKIPDRKAKEDYLEELYEEFQDTESVKEKQLKELVGDEQDQTDQ